MQKLKLFAQYSTGALFLKAKKEIEDQISQWPKEYFCDQQLGSHFESLKLRQKLNSPELDFGNGSATMVERVFPLSVFQPGLKHNAKVRINVLRYHYPFKGPIYMLGCCPAVPVPEPVGEWLVDSANQQICLEYNEYEKSPKKTIAAHQRYINDLQQCYEALSHEIRHLNDTIDGMIEKAVELRLKEIDDMERVLSLLK